MGMMRQWTTSVLSALECLLRTRLRYVLLALALGCATEDLDCLTPIIFHGQKLRVDTTVARVLPDLPPTPQSRVGPRPSKVVAAPPLDGPRRAAWKARADLYRLPGCRNGCLVDKPKIFCQVDLHET